MLARANNYIGLVIHHALRFSVINYRPNMGKFIRRNGFALPCGSDDNAFDRIWSFRNFFCNRNNKIRVIIVFVILISALVYHLVSFHTQRRNQFFLESESGMVCANIYFHLVKNLNLIYNVSFFIPITLSEFFTGFRLSNSTTRLDDMVNKRISISHLVVIPS